MAKRKAPNRGRTETWEASVAGVKVFFSVEQYSDGKPCALFIDVAPNTTTAEVRSWANVFSIAVSMALQYGCPIEKLVDHFVFTRFGSEGIVQGSADVKMASSILDYVFREIAVHYCGRIDLSHTRKLELNED